MDIRAGRHRRHARKHRGEGQPTTPEWRSPRTAIPRKPPMGDDVAGLYRQVRACPADQPDEARVAEHMDQAHPGNQDRDDPDWQMMDDEGDCAGSA